MLLFVVCGLVGVALTLGALRGGRNQHRGLGSGDYPYYANPGTLAEAERAMLASERTSERKEASLGVNTELMETHRALHAAAGSLSQ